jgi:hypothetical protein
MGARLLRSVIKINKFYAEVIAFPITNKLFNGAMRHSGPAIANERLSTTRRYQAKLQLKTPRRHGTTHPFMTLM